jgi:hypothetical protein
MPFSGVGFFLFTYRSFYTFGSTPWAGDQSSAKASTYTGQHNTRETPTHILVPSRIRNCDPYVRAAEDSTCLRPRGYCDRLHKNSFRQNVVPSFVQTDELKAMIIIAQSNTVTMTHGVQQNRTHLYVLFTILRIYSFGFVDINTEVRSLWMTYKVGICKQESNQGEEWDRQLALG